VLYILFVFMAISVLERTRELGLLRAVGMSRKQMGRTVLAEALLLAAMIPARKAARLQIVEAGGTSSGRSRGAG